MPLIAAEWRDPRGPRTDPFIAHLLTADAAAAGDGSAPPSRRKKNFISIMPLIAAEWRIITYEMSLLCAP